MQRALDDEDDLSWWCDDPCPENNAREPDASLEIEDESDTEDFAHPGTVVACKYYNTHESGCRFGKTCRSRHARDSKSVRDGL